MSYYDIKEAKVPDPCQGKDTFCSSTTIGTIYCSTCGLHYKDVINWIEYDDEQKIIAWKAAAYHKTAKKMNLVEGDNWDYDQASIHQEIERRLREADAETGQAEGG